MPGNTKITETERRISIISTVLGVGALEPHSLHTSTSYYYSLDPPRCAVCNSMHTPVSHDSLILLFSQGTELVLALKGTKGD